MTHRRRKENLHFANFANVHEWVPNQLFQRSYSRNDLIVLLICAKLTDYCCRITVKTAPPPPHYLGVFKEFSPPERVERCVFWKSSQQNGNSRRGLMKDPCCAAKPIKLQKKNNNQKKTDVHLGLFSLISLIWWPVCPEICDFFLISSATL